jgi:nitrogen fixation NifU-like protein
VPKVTEQQIQAKNETALRDMLSKSGYSDIAIDYYIRKPHFGVIENADQISGMVGTCGDSMTVYLKAANGRIDDVKYQIMGCAGSISAAMAAVDIVKGKTIEEALAITDGDVFRVLVNIPAKKHHCIQLSVKAMQKAINEYLEARNDTDIIYAQIPAGPYLKGARCCETDQAVANCNETGECCAKDRT